ncbi:MAG: RagB/SusD family nutrient uptake outer membrane protein [Muribaculum sp.]|nr:RagB/SusD family nutrient uptake outer membrane protein [Muribaculum sp.]
MKANKIFLAVGCAAVFTACADLDYKEYSIYEKSDIYTEFSRVDGVVTNVYGFLDNDMPFNGATCSGCDEADYSWANGSAKVYVNGSWSAANTPSYLSNMYRGIRAANIYLEDEALADFSELELDKDYDAYIKRFNRYQWEVRFLRAYFHFNLVRAYGDIPLVTTVLTDAEANSLTRTPSDEVFKFIVDECDAILAADMLPTDYTTLSNDASTMSTPEGGRVTKQAVMALKARTLTYWASPLFNNGANRWKEAAQANKDLIDLCEQIGIRLSSTYSALWAVGTDGNWTNSEMIFCTRMGSDNSVEYVNYPIGLENASGGNCPTQNMVDAYEVVENGVAVPFNWNNNTHKANPYANRDPRFYATIACNGDVWPTSYDTPLQTYYGGVNALPTVGGTPTGYYLKKWLDGTITITDLNPTSARRHTWITYRLGEFLLNYAECMNEAYGPATAGDGNLDMTATDAVNMIRDRAGMPEFPAGLSQDEFRTKYQNERMVELAFEGHRFWDVRRWKIGAQTQGANVKGVEITRNGDTFSYSPVSLNRPAWEEKMNLFPIPQSERLKNGNLTQNTGW